MQIQLFNCLTTSKLLINLPEWIADEQLNVNENRCLKEDPELSAALHDHYMFSLTNSHAHCTLPKFIDFFQNFCMKLWLWSHRVQDGWLESTSPQDVFWKELVPPGVLGEGGAQMRADVTERDAAVWSQNLPMFVSFQIWGSNITPWSRGTRKRTGTPSGPEFGICLLMPLEYTF